MILWREAGNKLSSCSDDSKYGSSILVQSEQQLNIQYHFGIFWPLIGEGWWYDDAASHSIKCICELFGNISFLYWIKPFLDLCKNWVDAELIYNLLSLDNCDILHLLGSDWSYMALIQV